ncbi:MAG: FAD-binding oxidoreductase [Chloroflexi bacterium]|nr:FAD-binding oxidoreductase [Chloroflexota bacterium]
MSATVEHALGPDAPWRGVTDGAADDLRIDGLAPRFEATPATPEELCAILREAEKAGLAVCPRGAGSKTSRGQVPVRYDLALKTTSLTGLLEYRPDDLVAVARAGTPLRELQRSFSEHGQWLALDPADSASATIGGTLAANTSGPHRYRYGTARDLVLGMQVAYAGGTLARSGAKVVKSVAGYDIHKLHIGALGTLGVITEVALRLHPLPASQQLVACAAPTVLGLAPVIETLMHLPLGLGAMELVNAAGAARLKSAGVNLPSGWLLLVLCEGHPRVVGRQVDEVRRAAASVSVAVSPVATDTAAVALLDEISRLTVPDERDTVVLKIAVPPGHTAAAIDGVEKLLAEFETSAQPVIQAHAGNGVVHVNLQPQVAGISDIVQQLRHAAKGFRGHVTVLACPLDAKRQLDVWGETATPTLMRDLKAALDPRAVLNPGRFVHGL